MSKLFNNAKKTRFKTATALLVFLGGVVIVGMVYDMEGIADKALSAIMLIAPTYLLGDSYRKS